MNQRTSLRALVLVVLASCGGDSARRAPTQKPADEISQPPTVEQAGAEGAATAYVDLVLLTKALPRTVLLTVKMGETVKEHELVKTSGSCLMPGDEKQRRDGAPLDDVRGEERTGYLVSFVCTEGNQRSTYRLYSTPAGIDVVSATQETKPSRSGPVAIGTPTWSAPRSFGVPADVGIVYGWAENAP